MANLFHSYRPIGPIASRQGAERRKLALSLSLLNEKIDFLQQWATNEQNTTLVTDVKQTISGIAQDVNKMNEYHEAWQGIAIRPTVVSNAISESYNACYHASSTQLQGMMFLRADPASFFKPLRFFTYPGIPTFECEETWTRYPSAHAELLKDDEIQIYATLKLNGELSRVGERFRSLLICQPPVMQVKPIVDCCNLSQMVFGPQHVVNEPDMIRSDTGITLGDILDATQKLKSEHRLCPYAQYHHHDERGFGRCKPSFKAIVRLQANDPFLGERRKKRAAMARRRAEQSSLAQRMNPYIQAKLNAHNNGLQIPTLAEFEAVNNSNSPA